MKIKVTQKHIDNGFKNNCWRCPIALAIEEQLINKSFTVASSTIRIQGNVINLPYEACNFIRKFDNGLPVEPFEFELDYNE